MTTFSARSSTAISIIALLVAVAVSSAGHAEAGPFKAARQQRKARVAADKVLDRLSAGKLGKPLAKLRKSARRAQAGWWTLKTSPATTALVAGGTGVAATESLDPKVRATAGAFAVLTFGVKQAVEGRAKRRMKRQANADTSRKLLEDPEYKGHLNGADEKALRAGYQIRAKTPE